MKFLLASGYRWEHLKESRRFKLFLKLLLWDKVKGVPMPN